MRVVKSVSEAPKLIELGFEYVTEMNGVNLMLLFSGEKKRAICYGKKVTFWKAMLKRRVS